MYYQLITGRIVTEVDMRKAYEIYHGSEVGTHPGHYEEWVAATHGVEKIIPKNEITVRQLIRGNCKVEAIRVYKEKHGCSLSEASKAIDYIVNVLERRIKEMS